MSKLFARFFKPELDPGRADRIYHEYDFDRGYARYHEFCKSRFTRRGIPASGGPLLEQGFEFLEVLNPGEAREIITEVTSGHEIAYIKKDTKNLQGFLLTDDRFIKNILSGIITKEVDERLVTFFRSEYLVHWITITKTPQADEQESVSFRWHCDKGPRSHLKLIVYLNGTDEHGGTTELIPLEDSNSVAAGGYLFGWSRARTGDISRLADIAGHDISRVSRSIAAGEGLIFQPAKVLHRGVSPGLGPRYVITLCLLPSPVDWERALMCGAMSNLSSDEKWHRHADDLLRIIERGPPH